MSMCLRGHVAAMVWVLALISSPVCAGEVRLAVASNFSAPIERIAALFQQESGHAVKVSLGSSGKFYAQIKEGAPFDVFLAADENYPRLLEQESLAVANSRFVYALGKLVLWSATPGLVDDKGTVLSKGTYDKIAYADAKLAPYGLAAQEALQKLDLWSSVQSNLVTGEKHHSGLSIRGDGQCGLGVHRVVADHQGWQGHCRLVVGGACTSVQPDSAKCGAVECCQRSSCGASVPYVFEK